MCLGSVGLSHGTPASGRQEHRAPFYVVGHLQSLRYIFSLAATAVKVGRIWPFPIGGGGSGFRFLDGW